MEPVTLIAAAIAVGASEGAREVTKRAIGDAYSALKSRIMSKYRSVGAEVEGLEQEPEEELRRQLLAKKLTQVGADSDNLVERTAEVAQETFEKARQVAGDVVEQAQTTAQQSAEKQGLAR